MLLKKILRLFALFIAPSFANAGYQLASTKQLYKYAPYVQIDQQKINLLASLNHIEKSDQLSTEILLQGMNCFDEDAPRKISASDFYFSASSISIGHPQPIALPVVDYLGQWHLAQIDAKAEKVNRTFQMEDFGVVRAGATSTQGYFIGGSDKNKNPLMIFYSHDFKQIKILSEKPSTEGEVSSIFNRGNEVFAIYNKRSDKYSSSKFLSKLQLYSPAGLPIANARLDGLDGTGLALEDGSVVVSYWDSGKIYMERLSHDLSPQWKILLHQVEGIASIRGSMLRVGQSLAWVGANDNRLLIHRVGQDGSIYSTHTESNHGLNAPQPLSYAASSYGDEIHVRGRTNRGQGATLSSVTEFCLVEKP